MENAITGQYFSLENFAGRVPEVLKIVCDEVGFAVEKELSRGQIYNADRLGAISYTGTYKNVPAVLKLQGLEPAIDEALMIEKFSDQNTSKVIRAPKVFMHSPWQKETGYGYMVMERVVGEKIFNMPWASIDQIKEVTKLYQEYKANAVTKPWVECTEKESNKFVFARVAHWQKVVESKKYLQLEEYVPYIERFTKIVDRELENVPMEFMHGHFSANDIYHTSSGEYVLFSNLFWSYRPAFYDVAFLLWACVQQIRDTSVTASQVIEYWNAWLEYFYELPVVSENPHAKKFIRLMLLERTMGSVLDIGIYDFYQEENMLQYFTHLKSLNQELFNWLSSEYE